MKYALLIYDDLKEWEKVPESDYPAIYQEYFAISELATTTSGAQLQPVETARSVRVKDGEPLVTDGPFAETKEVLGGFYLIDAKSQAEAEEIAARIPAARFGGVVEVRPLVER